MRPVSLELLGTFQAICTSGSLTGAASTLGLAQPTVTARLQALEAAVGTRLIDRGPRGCVPTAAGRELSAQVRGPIDRLQAIGAALGPPTTLAGARLRLGAPAEYFERRLAARFAPLVAEEMRLETRLGLAQPLLAALSVGELDLVVSTVKPPASLQWRVLADEEFVLVAAPALAARLDPAELATHPARALGRLPRVTYDGEQSITRRWWRHVLGRRPPSPPVATVPDLRSVLALVAAGVGASALPAYLCRDALERGEVVVLLDPPDAPLNTLFLVTRPALRHLPQVDAAWQVC